MELLAARAPKLRTAKRDGLAYVIIDGTLIPIDRVAADRPFSPDGTVLWVSGALPGSTHDTAAARIWQIPAALRDAGLIALGDKDYHGPAQAPLLSPTRRATRQGYPRPTELRDHRRAKKASPSRRRGDRALHHRDHRHQCRHRGAHRGLLPGSTAASSAAIFALAHGIEPVLSCEGGQPVSGRSRTLDAPAPPCFISSAHRVLPQKPSPD
ncbi:hypothetical protein FHX82_006511 [Amycolatopsis bartoniae]|uniref:Transposase family protein n=1 Tax=Amycolatopsis bartoniae TaxID=941986 RepID=A0A8H9MGQ9_9PSEU|nr:hypothetical protein [Amycolatopsis bartoniae]GHF83088.1 hypothetical protein GCM10017566_66380 [Amycolatopsis bartoniae]